MTRLLDEAEAARALSIQPKTLCRWRWEGKGPAFYKIGSAVRYKIDDIEEFISSARRSYND